MASFLEDLWGSVFTPGPTPTLLIATNISFALLQTLLFALLVATYSIHFLVLSFLCAGLWVSINWFAGELQAEQERARAEKAAKDGDARTEAKAVVEGKGKEETRSGSRVRERRSARTLKASAREGSQGRRREAESTDSEWEKVERSVEE